MLNSSKTHIWGICCMVVYMFFDPLTFWGQTIACGCLTWVQSFFDFLLLMLSVMSRVLHWGRNIWNQLLYTWWFQGTCSLAIIACIVSCSYHAIIAWFYVTVMFLVMYWVLYWCRNLWNCLRIHYFKGHVACKLLLTVLTSLFINCWGFSAVTIGVIISVRFSVTPMLVWMHSFACAIWVSLH